MHRPRTVGQLRATGYRPVRVKDEIRRNLLERLRRGEAILTGLVGYQDTVIPEVEHALLARHDLLLLGTRGQGKTRLLRQLVDLLDEAVPMVAGSELRDDPLAPVSAWARRRLAEQGDDTPIEWLGRAERYSEKLATPDVTMADLFGDIDLLKHVQGRSLADEESLHFGLVPRANRGIFCINELPDLAAKIQVGLFDLLQERDVQIRGFAVRFALDVCLVASANPEDYTSRGRIVTPLKDRLGSVIRTHDPRSRADGVAIVESNAWLMRDSVGVCVPRFMMEIVEEIARRARASPAVNRQSGVSARLAISGCELLVSSAERRALALGEGLAVPRVGDLDALLAAARGKLELLLGEDEGDEDELVRQLTGEAVRLVFADAIERDRLRGVLDWFAAGHSFRVDSRWPAAAIVAQLGGVAALALAAQGLLNGPGQVPEAHRDEPPVVASAVEFLLEGLHRGALLGKRREDRAAVFGREE